MSGEVKAKPTYRTHSLQVLRQIFKGEAVVQTPWPRMILCAVATLLPLAIGFMEGEIGIAIFGGLSGYMLALNDHLGTLLHRAWVTSLSFFILCVGFALGAHFRHDPLAYILMLGGVSYWLGLLGGEGAELERAVLFSLIGYITAYTTPLINPEVLPALFRYSLMSYACLVIGGPIVYLITRHKAAEFARVRHSLKVSLTLKYERHVYAACFTASVLAAVWFASEFKVEHGSWVAITVLIVLRPDRLLTVYKTLQRFFGTLVGVLCADVIVVLRPEAIVIILLLTICAFIIPWAILKNYWLTSFLVTVFVVLLLELASGGGRNLRNGNLRLEATFLGCCLSLIGVGLSRFADRVASWAGFDKSDGAPQSK